MDVDDVRSWLFEGYALRCLALAFFNRARCATRTAFFSFCGHTQWLSAKKHGLRYHAHYALFGTALHMGFMFRMGISRLFTTL
jgi:hypothetical protein